MMVSGIMASKMVLVLRLILINQSITELGKMVKSMEVVIKHTVMVLNIVENLKMAMRMAKDLDLILMDQSMMVYGETETKMDSVFSQT